MTTAIEAFNTYLDGLKEETDKESYLKGIFKKIKEIKENTVYEKTNLGLYWNTSIKNLALGHEPQVTAENTFDNAFQKILKELKTDSDYYKKFLETIKLQNKSVQPMQKAEYQKRIKSFFDMIIEGVKKNGFFVCQEDDYIRLYDYLMDETDIKINELLTVNKVGYIHATKVGFDDKKGLKGAPSTGKDMFIGAIFDGNNKYNNFGVVDKMLLGDGATIYYNMTEWSCVEAKCSSGHNKAELKYILHNNDESKIEKTLIDNVDDPCIIAKFKLKNGEPDKNIIIIATTHLASGETTTQCSKKANGKDCERKKTVNALLENIDNSIPVIIGMDGNSSAYTDHTDVVGLLYNKAYTSAIEDHTLNESYVKTNIIISSIKERGKVTNQPFKTEPIKNLIDYLVYSGENLQLKTEAILPKDINGEVSVEKYGIPSNFTEYQLPPTDKWGEMDQWFNWGSDHLPVRATFDLNGTTFDVTTLNALALTLTKDGFIQGSEWPLEKRIVKKYGKLLTIEQAKQIIAIGEKINTEATKRFGTIKEKVESTDVKLEMIEPPSVKSLESTVDKLIYKLFETLIDTPSAADVITDMENNSYGYVGDSIRFALNIPEATDKYGYVESFITQFIKNKEPSTYTNSNPVHDVTNGGINVKFIEGDDKKPTFRWEIQFLTDAAKNVYKNHEKHDLYKDMQRFLANLRYAKLTDADIEPLKKEYAEKLLKRVNIHSESLSVEQSDNVTVESVTFEKTKDTIIEMNEVINGIFEPIAQVAQVAQVAPGATATPSYMNPTESSKIRNAAIDLYKRNTDPFGNNLANPRGGGRKTIKNKKGGKYTRKRNKNKTNKLNKTKTKKPKPKPKPKPKSKITIM